MAEEPIVAPPEPLMSLTSIPTFMIFKNKGKVAAQFVGAMGKEGFLDEIQKAR
jgi:thioredoxin-related protein